VSLDLIRLGTIHPFECAKSATASRKGGTRAISTIKIVGKIAKDPSLQGSRRGFPDFEIEFGGNFQNQEVINAILVVSISTGIIHIHTVSRPLPGVKDANRGKQAVNAMRRSDNSDWLPESERRSGHWCWRFAP